MRRFLFVLPLILAGCTLVKSPSPLPRGYSSYAEPHKSAPGPQVPSIGYEYSTESNAEVTGIWRASVQDLLTRLEDETGAAPGAVYVVPSSQPGAMQATFDHVLREELTARGYEFSADPAAPRLGYDIDKPRGKFLSNEGTTEKGYEKLRYRDLILSLSLNGAGVSDTYYLPSAGSEALRNKVDYVATKNKVYNP